MLELIIAELNRQWFELCEHPSQDPDVYRPFHVQHHPPNYFPSDYGACARALMRLKANGTPLELFIEPLEDSEVPNFGDILVGLILDSHKKNESVTITRRGQNCHTLILHPHQPTAVLGSCFYPMIDSFEIIRLQNPQKDAKIKLVYAALNDEERKWFYNNSYLIPTGDSGAHHLLFGHDRTCLLHVPHCLDYFYIPSEIVIERKKQFIKIIEEELIRKTWHPLRLPWCLDINETKEILFSY